MLGKYRKLYCAVWEGIGPTPIYHWSASVIEPFNSPVKLFVSIFICLKLELRGPWCSGNSWKGGDREFDLRSGLQVLKKQNVSPPLTHKDSILW